MMVASDWSSHKWYQQVMVASVLSPHVWDEPAVTAVNVPSGASARP